MLVPKQIML